MAVSWPLFPDARLGAKGDNNLFSNFASRWNLTQHNLAFFFLRPRDHRDENDWFAANAADPESSNKGCLRTEVSRSGRRV